MFPIMRPPLPVLSPAEGVVTRYFPSGLNCAAPPGTATLRHATVVLPDAGERDRLLASVDGVEDTADGPMVRDPSGNALLLVASARE